VDSNGWRIRLARLRNPGKTVWVETDPPKADEFVAATTYLVGMADAAAHGGRWVLSFDARFGQAVTVREPAALADWKRVAAAAAFFRRHADWADLPARAALAIVSDFAGENEFLSHEILNLAARQQLPYRLVDKTRFQGLSAGLKAVLYCDAKPPAAAVGLAIARFVEAGGLLITGPAMGKVLDPPLPESPSPRYTLYKVAQGRIAATKEMDDPYLAAADAQVLLSHRNDVVRLWNGGSLGCYPTGDAKRSVVHLVNYSGQPGTDAVSVWIEGRFQSGLLHSFEFAEPKKLRIVPQRGGVELHLPPIAIYGAVEVS
jgi:hypothetical protein